MFVARAEVNTDDGRKTKTFKSEHYRGARWMAVRWINKNKMWHGCGWRWEITQDK